MKSRRVVLIVVVLLVIMGVGAGWSAWRQQFPEQKTFDFAGSGLTVIADDGELELVPVTGSDGQVSVTRWIRSSRWFGGTRADWRLESDRTLRLTSRCSGWFVSCDFRYRVEVPAGTDLRVRSEDGTVRAAGFTSALEIEARDGTIEVDDARGPLTLTADDGEIRARGLAAPRVTARADDGDIELDFSAAPQSVVVSTDDGRVDLTAPAEAYRITTRADEGSVSSSLTHDQNATRRIEASTKDGDISLHAR